MKTKMFIKSLLILPLIIFIDWIVMVLLGCISCIFRPGADFYCGTYCITGKVILILSGIIFLAILFTDIIRYRKLNKDAAAG